MTTVPGCTCCLMYDQLAEMQKVSTLLLVVRALLQPFWSRAIKGFLI
jgi:hypothetical protein